MTTAGQSPTPEERERQIAALEKLGAEWSERAAGAFWRGTKRSHERVAVAFYREAQKLREETR